MHFRIIVNICSDGHIKKVYLAIRIITNMDVNGFKIQSVEFSSAIGVNKIL